MKGSTTVVEFFTMAEVIVVNSTLFIALLIFSYKYVKKKLKD
jgi:hypothetical protein